MWSMSFRFTSSGDELLKDLLPASMWNTSTPNRFAIKADVLEFVSPSTRNLSGWVFSIILSNFSKIIEICLAKEPLVFKLKSGLLILKFE